MRMSEQIRVPEPVYDRLIRESERKDTTLGEIVRDWMEAADRLDEMDRGY